MISKLTGQVSYRGDRFIVLEVAGVGYKVFVVNPERPVPDSLWTHLAVREDALELYGFRTKEELDFFELLISVSGIGPKSALGILALAAPEVLARAIGAGDSSYLTRVSGIGKKSAEKIILELRDKVGSLEMEGGSLKEEADAIEALQSLGYSLAEAREALRQVGAEASETGAKVRAALKFLGKR